MRTLVLEYSPIFTKSRRGNLVLKLGPYQFNRVNSGGPRYRWRCNRNPYGCRATVHTIHDTIVKFRREHKH
ncbi:unnamed protein product, partial [Iphiclides podalirius]